MTYGQIELPRFRGIEEAIADVRDFGLRTGREMLIGLRRDGTRAFEAEGSERCVRLPDEWVGRCKGVFLVHCHPSMPTELSLPDIECFTWNLAEGNLAVCCQDGTISWTDDKEGPRSLTWVLTAPLIFRDVHDRLRLQNSKEEPNWKWVALSHLANRRLSSAGCLQNYHVWLGEKAQECLQRGGYRDSN